MYYWCLMSHKKRGDHNKLAKTVKWMEFEVGRVYMDHLIASKKLNEFYSQIQLPREDGPRGLLVLGQEGAMLPRSRIVKEVERRLRGGKKDPQNDRAVLARPRGTNNELETIQHASKSSPGGQKFISDHKQYLIDKLNFEKFWGRSSQNPHLLNSYKGPVANSALIHMSFQRFAEKRKSVTASLEGSERDVAAGSKKKPRTQSVVGSSSEGGGSHFPAGYAGPTTLLTDGTQSTLYRNNPMLKDTPTSQESRTGGETAVIDPTGFGRNIKKKWPTYFSS
ncbi:uncharacterized protein MELLADRAFT_66204 [Melampsora larici-populina 98AG31]|uniref:Uncharacterized protein n=1 Tax=Melampsora larici-populina (strain 98AG31 / pathotype 3-4-7) TaxID=747676 RepID=F4RY89_MELLP|nr:uncharacterized protein MELLADRAFT_66204 [Melampsora larici-populina 98AG31]EGG02636.1 hypothetical protein MELLADRAFT_66204 [Melampsora larici-populina 98AG31]